MAQNSTPTTFINLAALAPELNTGSMSAPVFFGAPQEETVALGPVFQHVIDAGTASASPPVLDVIVDYIDIFVYSIGTVAATGLNIIQYANRTEAYIDELVLDTDTLIPLGSGSIQLGSHRYEMLYLPPTSYSVPIEKSRATIINPHTTLVTVTLPSGAPAGTIYSFIAASGQIKISAPTTRMFVGPSGWLGELNQSFTLPKGTNSSFVCNGLHHWYNARPSISGFFS